MRELSAFASLFFRFSLLVFSFCGINTADLTKSLFSQNEIEDLNQPAFKLYQSIDENLLNLIVYLVRGFKRIVILYKKIVYYEVIGFFYRGFKTSNLSTLGSEASKELLLLFQMNSQLNRSDLKSNFKCFSPELFELSEIIKNSLFQSAVSLFRLVCRKNFKKILLKPKASHSEIMIITQFYSINQLNSLERNENSNYFENDNIKSVSSRYKSGLAASNFDITRLNESFFNHKEQKTRIFKLQEEFERNYWDFLNELMTPTKLFPLMKNTSLFFQENEIMHLKAFNVDPFSFDAHVIQCRRLHNNLQRLEKLMRAMDCTEDLEVFALEIKRVIDKIIEMFRSCESETVHNKLQNLLKANDVPNFMLSFLKEENCRANTKALVQSIIDVLVEFCQRNSSNSLLVAGHFRTILNLMDREVDSGSLLFVSLRELQKTPHAFLTEIIYLAELTKVSEFCLLETRRMTSQNFGQASVLKNANSYFRNAVLLKSLSNNLRDAAQSSKLIRKKQSSKDFIDQRKLGKREQSIFVVF